MTADNVTCGRSIIEPRKEIAALVILHLVRQDRRAAACDNNLLIAEPLNLIGGHKCPAGL